MNERKLIKSLIPNQISAGGNEPRLVAAATAQLNTLPFYHSFWNRTTKPSLVFIYSSVSHDLLPSFIFLNCRENLGEKYAETLGENIGKKDRI